jgi:rRNA maturation endonuclease Nob1
MQYVSPPKQDASGDVVIKSLYICPTRGCRSIMQTSRKHCDDCGTAAERKVIESEYDEKYAVKVTAGIL